MKTRNIFALCALIILPILTACESKTGIKEKQAETNTHDSFSIREKYAPDDSAPLERKLIPPKQIDDLRNFQVVYCFDIDSSCPLCDYHLFSFNDKVYEPRLVLSYRNSSLDSMLRANAEGYMEYSKKDLDNDPIFYGGLSDELNFWYGIDSLKPEWTIDESKKIRLYKNKLIDNGRTFDIDVINYNEYYCYYKNMLVIYKFTKNLVDPMDNYHDDKINVLHLPYVFKDMPENETK